MIVPNDGQQAAMQNDDLFASTRRTMRSGSNSATKLEEPRKLLGACKLHRMRDAHLETEIPQGSAQIILNGDGL
jgi:hypothetical protein